MVSFCNFQTFKYDLSNSSGLMLIIFSVKLLNSGPIDIAPEFLSFVDLDFLIFLGGLSFSGLRVEKKWF